MLPYTKDIVWTDEAVEGMKGKTTTLRADGKAIGEAVIVNAKKEELGIAVTFEIKDPPEELRKVLGQ